MQCRKLTSICSHGRDNKIHVFQLPHADDGLPVRLPSPSSPTNFQPLQTIEINAVGYCKSGFCSLPEGQALVAVPAVLDDSLVDVFHLPSRQRVYRSIGKDTFESKTGTVMALSIYTSQVGIRIVASYEDGRLAVFEQLGTADEFASGKFAENEGWQKLLETKHHREPSQSERSPGSACTELLRSQPCRWQSMQSVRKLGWSAQTILYLATICATR